MTPSWTETGPVHPAYQARIDAYLKTASATDKRWFAAHPHTFQALKGGAPNSLSNARKGERGVHSLANNAAVSRDLSAKHEQTLAALKSELLEDTRWHTSNAALAAAVIGGSIGAFCSLLLDLIPAANPLAPTLVRQAYEHLYVALARGDTIFWRDLGSQIIEGFAWASLEDRVTNGIYIREATLALAKFAASLAEVMQAGRDRDELRQEVQRQIQAIDEARANYQTYMVIAPHEVERLDAQMQKLIRGYIDVHTRYNDFISGTSQKSLVSDDVAKIDPLILGTAGMFFLGGLGGLIALRMRRTDGS